MYPLPCDRELGFEPVYTGDFTYVALLIGTPTGGLLLGTFLGSLSGTKVIYRAPIQEND